MSQAGELNVTQNHPEIPTTFDANTGSATPLANVLNIFGQAVVAGGIPVTTTASGNTLTVDVQRTTTSASSSATNAGLASFNSADFSVDANGYVSFTGSGSTETLTGNTGGAVSPTAGNINTVGTGSITVVGNPGTSTLTTQLTGLTAHNILLGEGTATVGLVAPSATSGVPLISQGATSDPAFGTAVVAGGGTGDTSFTVYAPICGGTSTTGALQSASTGIATSGFVLTSTGAASLPTFQTVSASGAITTITGNSGGAETPSAGNFNIVGTGSITTVGTAATETIQLTGLTAHNVLLGEGTATVGLVAPSATSGVPLISQGAASDPAFGTAVVAGGGTGATSFNTNGVIISNTTATGVLAAVSLTDGQVVIGSSIGAPTANTLTAGAGISITNGHNSITIAANGTTTLNVTPLTHAASPYTVLSTDDFLAITGSVGTFTVKLPNAPATGRVIIIKDTNGVAATDNIAVTTVGGTVTIDGQTTYTMATNYQSISVIFDGSNYEVF